MSDETFLNSDSPPSPAAAFLSGLLAGVLVPVLGILRGGTEESSLAFWWASPLLSAALAGGATAYKMGSSVGRTIALILLAVCCAFFVRGVLDYLTLYDAIVSPALSSAGSPPEMRDILWRWQFVSYFLSVTTGALLGLLFGRRE